MIRFVKDFTATLLLRLFILLLSPGLIFAGRSLRAKFLGFRALLILGMALTVTGLYAAVEGGLLPISDYFTALLYGTGPSFALVVALQVGLQYATPALPIDLPVGWSAFGYGVRPTFETELTVAVENDFLGTVIGLMTRIHPLLTREQAATIRGTLADDFNAMAERPELERLPSMLPWNLGMLLPDRQQAFVYCPPHDKGEKLPLVVVCHGHGGNPLVGCLPWADLADDLGFVAAFPTFGYGNWEHPAAGLAIVKCRRAVTDRFAVDETRAVLAGISQGGCGVTRGATVAKWAGLVYVSPTMEVREFAADTAFAELWTGGPVLVAQGGRDINVKPKTVDAGVAALRAIGVAVTYVQDPDADHFYFFEKRDEFAEQFRAWWPTAIPPAG